MFTEFRRVPVFCVTEWCSVVSVFSFEGVFCESDVCFRSVNFNFNFPQQCNLKVYSRWLWIFSSLKSPEEWVITKLACRDESVVFFLFPMLYITLYFNVWSTLLRKNRNTVFLMCVMLLCTLALKQKFFPWMAIVYALQSKIVACHKRRTMWMWLIVLQKEEF